MKRNTMKNSMTRMIAALAIAMVFVAATTASAAELEPSDGAGDDRFGVQTSLSGTTGLVGASRHATGMYPDRGAAYLYRGLDTATGTVSQTAKLIASDGQAGDEFGLSASLSSAIGLVGAYYHDTGGSFNQGAAYLYRNLDTAAGTVTEQAKLISSDGGWYDYFGFSVSLSSATGLVGAFGHDIGGVNRPGAAYLYRNLDTAAGTVTEDVKLIASDGAAADRFGESVSLSSATGLVGASTHNTDGNTDRGAAYLYRGLDSATGTVTEDVKLIASDGGVGDEFGLGTSLSSDETTGLVGAQFHDTGGTNNQGAAYLYRNLDTATGTVTETAKLISSDGAAADYFGNSVSLSSSGATGLVGAKYHDIGGNSQQGAAYLYRGLDTATGTVTEDAKLIASDAAADDQFGLFASLSGTTGLVGALGHDTGGNADQGAVYLYRNLDTATGTVTENVKLWASDGDTGDIFGLSVSLDGDRFIIGALGAGAGGEGRAYTGSVSAMTTLDDGSTKVTDGLSFESRNDWVIGETSSNNQVTLNAGDSADVTETGKGVYVGQNNGSNANTLVVDGDLNANHVQVGNGSNTGNTLAGSGTITGDVTNEGIIAPGNSPGTLSIDGTVSGSGDYIMEIASAISYDQLDVTGSVTFDGSVIDVNLLGGYAPGMGETFTLFSAGSLVDSGGYSFDFADAGGAAAWDTSNFLTTGAITSTVPEPTTMGLLGLGGLALLRRRSGQVLRRRRNRKNA